jgi:threonine/homoserine/homoserine lactone efflux protein
MSAGRRFQCYNSPVNNYLSIFAVSFAVALSGALMPGPLLAAVVAESAGGGFWAGPLISLGHALLEGGLLTLLVLGLGRFMSAPPLVAAITLAGSLFLLYSGISMLRSLRGLTLEQAMKRSSKPARLVAAGAIVSVSNPYWMVWWMTVGLGFALSAQKTGIAGVGVFFCGHILADIIWYSCVSYLTAGRRSFISERVYKSILFCCAITLLAFGLYFLLRMTIPR